MLCGIFHVWRFGLFVLALNSAARFYFRWRPELDAATYFPSGVDDSTSTKSISFSVCNGFTNQRLSMLYGLVIAKATGRAVEMPLFSLFGAQYGSADVVATGVDGVQMAHFYDEYRFKAAMALHGINAFVTHGSVCPPETCKRCVVSADEAIAGRGSVRLCRHLEVSACPLFKLGSSVISHHRLLVVDYLASLVPNGVFAQRIKKISNALGNSFNFLHLRIENDWLRHCAVWKTGDPSDNCFTNTLDVDKHLLLKGIEMDTPLYVGLDWDAAVKPLVQVVLTKLKLAGYSVVVSSDVIGEKKTLKREERAMVEYYLALSARKFIGNSVSTFSALVILERQLKGMWASYYNMGDIPLADYIPFFVTPWVFTYNGNSPHYDYMLKTSVLSAKHVGQLQPYCIYDGSENDSIYQWMQAQGVVLVQHTPSWIHHLDVIYAKARHQIRSSPLYGTKQMLAGTLQRLDIPIIRELAEFNYVLYTDVDVVFLRSVSLQAFARPFPTALSMSFESDDRFPCNAGVILMNLPALRETHSMLIDFAFSTPTLHFGAFGPIDQGALNQFYRQLMHHSCSLPETFNMKPHKNHNITNPYIMHFHGPKILDYHNWMLTGHCEFGDKCSKGARTICKFAEQFSIVSDANSPYAQIHAPCCKRYKIAC